MHLELHFFDQRIDQDCAVSLDKIVFSDLTNGTKKVTLRGKSSGFQWTSAVKALTLLFVKTQQAQINGLPLEDCYIEGESGSLAASLDYALLKRTKWIFDLFGFNQNGDTVLIDWIIRINSGRKRSGPVRLKMHPNLLTSVELRIYLDNKIVTDDLKLQYIITCIEQKKNVEIAPHLNHTEKLIGKGPIIVPASESDIEDIHEFERIEYPDGHVTLERLFEWRAHDPNNIMVTKFPDERFLAYYILLFPKPETAQAFLSGELKRVDISSTDLLEPSFEAYMNCQIMHICSFAYAPGSAIFTADLMWHCMARLVSLARTGLLSKIYTETINEDGKNLAIRLGFSHSSRASGTLHELTFTPFILKQWEERIRLRSFGLPIKSEILHQLRENEYARYSNN